MACFPALPLWSPWRRCERTFVSGAVGIFPRGLRAHREGAAWTWAWFPGCSGRPVLQWPRCRASPVLRRPVVEAPLFCAAPCSARCGAAPVLYAPVARGRLFCGRVPAGSRRPSRSCGWRGGRLPWTGPAGGAAVVRSTLGSGGAGLPAAGDGKSAGHIPAGELLQEEADDIGAALIRVGDGQYCRL